MRLRSQMNSSQTPTVDIALTTCNGEKYLPELLQSIEQQTYRRWNLIVGDDVSTDKTIEILTDFAVSHPDKVTILSSTERTGVTANFSRILKAGNAAYAMPADQDDIWLPNKIEITLQRSRTIESETEEGTPVLVHTDAIVTNENGENLNHSLWQYQNFNPEYGLKLKNLMVQNVITGCTTLINRPLLSLALPIPSRSIMHDWWLGLVAAAFGKIDYINEPTLFYRQHADNQIGAKRWSTQHIANEAASGLDALRKRIHATQRQAEEFNARFAGHLRRNEQNVLDAYTQLNSRGAVTRRLIAARRRFHKCGMLRTAGFYAAL